MTEFKDFFRKIKHLTFQQNKQLTIANQFEMINFKLNSYFYTLYQKEEIYIFSPFVMSYTMHSVSRPHLLDQIYIYVKQLQCIY